MPLLFISSSRSCLNFVPLSIPLLICSLLLAIVFLSSYYCTYLKLCRFFLVHLIVTLFSLLTFFGCLVDSIVVLYCPPTGLLFIIALHSVLTVMFCCLLPVWCCFISLPKLSINSWSYFSILLSYYSLCSLSLLVLSSLLWIRHFCVLFSVLLFHLIALFFEPVECFRYLAVLLLTSRLFYLAICIVFLCVTSFLVSCTGFF